MDEEKRRQLLERGRRSFEQRQQLKASPATNGSPAVDPTVSPANGHVHDPEGLTKAHTTPFSPIMPIPMASLDASPFRPTQQQPPELPLDLGPPMPRITSTELQEKEAKLSADLSAANMALISLKAELAQLKSDHEALKRTASATTSELQESKRQYAELKENGAATLQSQLTALKDGHAREIHLMQSQWSHQQAEHARSQEQLKKDKIELQESVTRLQQQIAAQASSSSKESDALTHLSSQLDLERSKATKLVKELDERSVQLNQANRELDSFKASLTANTQTSAEEVSKVRREYEATLQGLRQQHEAELQQLSARAQSAEDTAAASSSPSEVKHLEDALRASKEAYLQLSAKLDEKERVVATLQTQLENKSTQLSELSAELKRSSEQSKHLQSQTNSNFAQIEQMKQQVLRDRAELSKKLSLIAPETTRRLEQLQSERDAVHAQLQEQIKTIMELSQQKSELLSRLTTEVGRNSILIQHNTKLRHQLELQMAALGEPIALPKPPIELVKEDAIPTSPTTPKLGPLTEPQELQKLAAQIVELDATSATSPASLAADAPDSTSSDLVKKKPQRYVPRKKSQKATTTSTKPENGKSPTPSSSTPADQPANGWLASVPLVGRFMRGQPQVRHTLQVEL